MTDQKHNGIRDMVKILECILTPEEWQELTRLILEKNSQAKTGNRKEGCNG